MKFSIKEFFSKCDQIRSFLLIWSHLLKKSLMETFVQCNSNMVEDEFRLNLETYSKPYQTSKIKLFAKPLTIFVKIFIFSR